MMWWEEIIMGSTSTGRYDKATLSCLFIQSLMLLKAVILDLREHVQNMVLENIEIENLI